MGMRRFDRFDTATFVPTDASFIRINIPDAFGRMGTKFNVLAGSGTSTGYISSIIQPTTDLDQLLRRYGSEYANVTTAVGQLNLLTVPSNERWTLQMFRFQRSSGDRLVDAILLRDQSLGANITISEFTAVSAATHEFRSPITLDSGDSLRVRITGGTTDGSMLAFTWGSSEDAF
jgi:hypothetical protein